MTDARQRPLNRLEQLGWTALASQVLAIRRGEAAALCALVTSPGRIVTVDALNGCFQHYESSRAYRHPRFRLSTRIARVRSALEDAGVPRTAIENQRTVGYAVAPHHARQIRQIVEGA